MQTAGTTGLHTWPAALFLANHVLSHPELVTDAHLLELGSGAGMLAVLASQVQRTGSGTIISSDFHDAVLRRLRYNIEASRCVNYTKVPVADARSSRS